MTWEIFLGISALSTFIISVMAVVVKVTKALTATETALKTLADSFNKANDNNEKEHRELSKKLRETEKNIFINKMKLENIERM